jgi:hypothetical protein
MTVAAAGGGLEQCECDRRPARAAGLRCSAGPGGEGGSEPD